MSSKLISLLLLIALLWASAMFSAQAAAFPGFRQSTDTTDTVLLRQLGQASGGAVRIVRHAETGKARFIETASAQPLWQPNSLTATTTPEQASRAFLSIYGSLFGLRDQDRELTPLQQERLNGH